MPAPRCGALPSRWPRASASRILSRRRPLRAFGSGRPRISRPGIRAATPASCEGRGAGPRVLALRPCLWKRGSGCPACRRCGTVDEGLGQQRPVPPVLVPVVAEAAPRHDARLRQARRLASSTKRVLFRCCASFQPSVSRPAHAGQRVRRHRAANVEADFQVADPPALPALCLPQTTTMFRAASSTRCFDSGLQDELKEASVSGGSTRQPATWRAKPWRATRSRVGETLHPGAFEAREILFLGLPPCSLRAGRQRTPPGRTRCCATPPSGGPPCARAWLRRRRTRLTRGATTGFPASAGPSRRRSPDSSGG